MMGQGSVYGEFGQKIYGDKNQCLTSVTKVIQKYQQLPNKPVRVYTQFLKANWRRVGWNLIMHKVVPYNMASVGLQHQLQMKVRCWISSSKDRFDTLHQLFNCVASSQLQLDDNNPSGHHQYRQSGKFHHGGDMRSNFRATISEPVESTCGYSNPTRNCIHFSTRTSTSGKSNKLRGGSCANFSPVLWLSKEV